ncbi:MAG TPA: peptidase C25 [Thermoplasmatales archaeon]|nr:peptidase C25 [Thermoplasmatales archaeon]
MKAVKVFLALCMGSLLLGGTALVGIPVSPLHTENAGNEEHVCEGRSAVSFSFSPPNITERNGYAEVRVEEADTYVLQPGAPRLPVVTKTLTFPLGTRITEVTCVPREVLSVALPGPVAPALGAVPRNGQMADLTLAPDPAVYGSDHLYPGDWMLCHLGVGLYGGERVVLATLEVYPVRYRPAAGELLYASHVDISLTYEQQPYPAALDQVDLLIVAPQRFQDELEPLVEHKEQHGVATRLMALEGIVGNYEGRDDAEKIKYCIKQKIEEWDVRYVMLVGGMNRQRWWSWHLPVRYSHLDDNSGWEASYISDLYYADVYRYDNGQPVFDDWDSNGNGVFAEWTPTSKDVLDLYPDVYLGRLPCRTEEEVTVMVDKIMDYENTAHGQEWFRRMVAIGGDSFEDDVPEIGTDYIEGQVECDQALSYMQDFEQIRVYVEGGDYPFTPHTAEEVLSEGAGFVYFSGHGNPTSWATHPHGDFSTWIDFNLESIGNLTNHGKWPVLVVGGCHNSQFNVSMLNLLKIWEGPKWFEYLWKGETSRVCWGWLFARHHNGGSIATIGNTGLGYGTVGDGPVDEVPDSVPDGIPDVIQYLGGWLEPHFFQVYANGTTVLGEVHATALADYLNRFPIDWSQEWQGERPYTIEQVDCKTVQEWVLFGDPSLRIGGYP